MSNGGIEKIHRCATVNEDVDGHVIDGTLKAHHLTHCGIGDGMERVQRVGVCSRVLKCRWAVMKFCIVACGNWCGALQNSQNWFLAGVVRTVSLITVKAKAFGSTVPLLRWRQNTGRSAILRAVGVAYSCRIRSTGIQRD